MDSTSGELFGVIKKLATHDFAWFLDFVERYAWAVELLIVLFITVIASYIEHFVYQKLHPEFLKKKKHWQHAFIHALHKPLFFLIWLVGITFAIELAFGYFERGVFFTILTPIRKVGILFLLVWFAISFIQEIEKLFLMRKEDKTHLDKTTIRAVGQVLRIIVIVGGAFFVLQTTLGVGASAVLAFAGGGSFIIGWAAKDMLANIFGGLMIFLDRPFVIGDKICSVDKEIEGYVEHIGWRLTCVRTLEKVPVYVPNSFFSSMSIENPSRMTHRRIYANIGLRHCDAEKIPSIIRDIAQMLKSHPELDQNEPTFVNFVNFGPASLDILVYAFTEKTDLEEFYNVRQDVFFKILNKIASNDAICAFPITEGKLTVSLEK